MFLIQCILLLRQVSLLPLLSLWLLFSLSLQLSLTHALAIFFLLSLSLSLTFSFPLLPNTANHPPRKRQTSSSKHQNCLKLEFNALTNWLLIEHHWFDRGALSSSVSLNQLTQPWINTSLWLHLREETAVCNSYAMWQAKQTLRRHEFDEVYGNSRTSERKE